MARYVLPVVGAVVGFYVGGPAGAAWGWQIGAGIGSLVDPQTIKGPGVGDLAQQTSQAGVPRPIVFGRSIPISGNVIASSEPRIVKKKSSGKGGPNVETESVFRTYAIRVCEGPVNGYLRVWRNNVLVYDARANSDLSPEDNAKFLQNARLFLGDYDQMPSPDLEAVFGVGITPAHRGTCYVVFADEDLTDLRGAIPQWQFQVARGNRVGILSNAQLHPWITTPQADPRNPLGTYKFTIENTGNRSLCGELGPELNIVGEWDGFLDALDVLNAAWDDAEPGFLSYNSSPIAYSSTYDSLADVYGDPPTAEDGSPGPATQAYRRYNWLHLGVTGEIPDVIGSGAGSSGNMDAYVNGLASAGQRVFIANRFASEFNGGANVWKRAGPSIPMVAPFSFGSFFLPPQVATCGDSSYLKGYATGIIRAEIQPGPPTANADLVSGTFKVLQPFLQLGSAQSTQPNKFPLNPCLRSDDPDYSNQAFWESNYAAAVTAGYMSPGQTYGVDYPTVQNWAYFYYDEIAEETIPVVDIIDEILERVGLTHYDASELEDLNTWGLTVINQYPVYTAIQALGQVYIFDGANIDGQLKFVRRGADTVATITADDFLDDGEFEFETAQRQDSIAVPRVLHLNYFDVDGGLATDKQTSERPESRRSTGEQSLSSAVIMDADQAAQVVTIQHKVGIEELRGERKFSLPDKFIGLTITDNILLEWDSAFYRVRILSCEIMDGFQQYTCVHDRQSTYTSDVEGIPAAPQTPPPSSIVGPTLLQPLDIHILRDVDDAAGLIGYIAVSGTLPAWQGALIEVSYDGGANYVDSFELKTSSIMGSLMTALPDHPQEYPDEINTFSVVIQTPDAQLDETDLTGMLNGQNLAIIGDELIQFATTDETSEGTWDVSYLLRGRKGTETAEHDIGERFVLLQRSNLLAIPANLTDIGREITFRATSFGGSIDDATVVTITYTGQSQTEREASYLMAGRDGDTLTATWLGVGRLGAGTQAAHGQRFAGYRVTFSDGVNADIVAETTDSGIVQDVSTLDSPCTVTVEQLNSLTGAGPAIEVIA